MTTPNGPVARLSAGQLPDALSAWAAGVTLVTIADDRDDIGTTVSAFCPVSLDPPMVLVSLIADSYPAEVLSRPSLPAARFAITLLSASQRVLAGRFAASGRPSARLAMEDVPHSRGASSGALIPGGGLAALECSVARRVPAGDHLLVISAVTDVAYVTESGEPLIRFRGRYPALLSVSPGAVKLRAVTSGGQRHRRALRKAWPTAPLRTCQVANGTVAHLIGGRQRHRRAPHAWVTG